MMMSGLKNGDYLSFTNDMSWRQLGKQLKMQSS
jgi:hypothetical protein